MSGQDSKMSSLRLARREKILDAAEMEFIGKGVRAVTMEGVAHAARMSKATLYGYFSDKGVLFEAVASRVADRLSYTFENALKAEGLVVDLISDALSQKHLMVWDLVRQSPFASELFSATNHFAASTFADLDQKIESALTATLRKHKVREAKSQARILFGGSRGIANHASNRNQLKKDIDVLVQALLMT